MGSQSYQYKPYMPREPSALPATSSSGGGGQLKSCLRRGNFSQQKMGLIGIGGGTTVGGGKRAGSILRSSSRQQYHQQQQHQQHQHQHHQQAREEEECSTRSAASASTVHSSATSVHTNRSAVSTAKSAASSATTAASSHNNNNNNNNNNTDSSIKSSDKDDNERQFMQISKSLVTQHMSGKYSNASALSKLIHEHMPQYEQRRAYYSSLRRNVAYLPMFPEPNEHPSLAMTRYVEKMFDPMLAREVEHHESNGRNENSTVGSGSGNAAVQMTSPTSYGTQRYPQHFQNGNHPTARTGAIQSGVNNNAGLISTTSYGTQRYPQQQQPPPPTGPAMGVASSSRSTRNALLDEPMFAPPPPRPPGSSSKNHRAYQINKHVVSSTINLHVPPPIPIQYHAHVPQTPSPVNNMISVPPIKTTMTTTRASITPPVPDPITMAVPAPLASRTDMPTTMESNAINGQHSSFNFSISAGDTTPTACNARVPMPAEPLATRSLPQTHQHDVSQGKTPRTSNLPGAIRTTAGTPSAALSPLSSSQQHATMMSEAKTPRTSNLPTAIRTRGLTPLAGSSPQSPAIYSPTSPQNTVTFSPSAISSVSSAGGGAGMQSDLNKVTSLVSAMTVNTEQSSHRPTINSHRSLMQSSTESVSPSELERNKDYDSVRYRGGESENDIGNRSDLSYATSASGTTVGATSSISQQQYQTFSNKDMLPPITPREDILYYPDPSLNDDGTGSPCCGGARSGPRSPRDIRLPKRPPEYLQLYVKCERSEPFVNEDRDIETWYMDAEKRVTADRTLVARGSTDMIEFIGGIVKSFGLSPPSPEDDDVSEGKEDGVDGDVEKMDDADNSSESLLGCYKDICFVSDVKMTTDDETGETHLIPLPVPGLYYKYIGRPGFDGGDSVGDSSSKKKKKKKKKRKEQPLSKSSVLSTDPAGLRRTLIAQLLDKPVHPNRNDDHCHKGEEERVRTRMALVYCAPKRKAFISSRSTFQGTMPETIYHFQILLEGIVAEEDLPSSFQSQTSLRCVGATGGVLGGSVMDTREEIDDLNRKLWRMRKGDDVDVIGLATPNASPDANLEQIIEPLGVPLFDFVGNQTPREFVVDRCLYNIYSGKLSMEVARKTQHAVEAVENTTEWLARRVEEFTRGLADGAAACEDTFLSMVFENEKLEEFDAVVSRFGIVGATSQPKWI